ncbi:hypothetical protein BDP27DRAFT_1232175 [Rhodocollybia butyracea]|uniref:Phenazine biosynthesis-like protein n=1 Tax=Rhodocollybia butyracea TaxID=206335 RepID=A0A9P5PK23_9AGAR|nr:hypothetical protein BDP27DRAFT_1232175 [Rhodocollybia butyracea]
MKVNFITLDVFTQILFQGNPLAVILLDDDSPRLTQEQKQLVAREFNLSETIFIHDVKKLENQADPNATFTIDIFTINQELPFAGHPTIGAGWLLSRMYPKVDSFVLSTKAGKIPVSKVPGSHNTNGGIKLQIPIDFKEHSSYHSPELKSKSRQSPDYVNGVDGAEPVASIVKGMSFMLLQLTSVDALSNFQPITSSLQIPDEHLGAWRGFSALYVFVLDDANSQEASERGLTTVHTRMFEGGFEDPATGSAASTLCGWLAARTLKGPGSWKFHVIQGVDMGRESHIELYVEVGRDGEIEKIELAGGAVEAMRGTITLRV